MFDIACRHKIGESTLQVPKLLPELLENDLHGSSANSLQPETLVSSFFQHQILQKYKLFPSHNLPVNKTFTSTNSLVCPSIQYQPENLQIIKTKDFHSSFIQNLNHHKDPQSPQTHVNFTLPLGSHIDLCWK